MHPQDQSPPITVAQIVRDYFGFKTSFMVRWLGICAPAWPSVRQPGGGAPRMHAYAAPVATAGCGPLPAPMQGYTALILAGFCAFFFSLATLALSRIKWQNR